MNAGAIQRALLVLAGGLLLLGGCAQDPSAPPEGYLVGGPPAGTLQLYGYEGGTGYEGMSVDSAQAIPVTVSSPVTLYRLGVTHDSAAPADIALAVYTDSGGMPTTKLVQVNLVTGFGTDVREEVDIAPVTVGPGTFWLAIHNISGSIRIETNSGLPSLDRCLNTGGIGSLGSPMNCSLYSTSPRSLFALGN